MGTMMTITKMKLVTSKLFFRPRWRNTRSHYNNYPNLSDPLRMIKLAKRFDAANSCWGSRRKEYGLPTIFTSQMSLISTRLPYGHCSTSTGGERIWLCPGDAFEWLPMWSLLSLYGNLYGVFFDISIPSATVACNFTFKWMKIYSRSWIYIYRNWYQDYI